MIRACAAAGFAELARGLHLLTLGLLTLGVSGCAFGPDPSLGTEIRESALTAEEVAAALDRAATLFAEPRSVDRVEEALALCLGAISPSNGHAALWRGAQVAGWLAEHHPVESERHRYAALGMRLGERGVAENPDDVAAHFFYAYNIGQRSALEGRGLSWVDTMAKHARRIIELDPRYEWAGGHRFLGMLCDETKDYPLVAVGTIDDALEHLERACEIAPEYGQNHLALARVLLQDEEVEAAREHLELIPRLDPPVGHAADHERWCAEARRLLTGIDADG